MNEKNQNAVINPVKGRKSPNLGPFAVMVSSEKDIHLLREHLPAKDIAGLAMSRIYAQDSPAPYYSLTGPVISSPYAVMLMEPLIAYGAREILFFGWCGSISPNAEIGDIIVPSGAIIEEGTSLHYGGCSNGIARPCEEFSLKIKQMLINHNLDFHEGLIWTTDAVYRETYEKIDYFQSRNALAVEMELSALFTVGKFRNIPVSAILVVSDELSTLKWKPGFADERFLSTRKAVAEAIASFCNQKKGPAQI
ncbi:MAG: nucleoside phosphorylase [Desulfobacterales bacterium]